ncbi:PDZ domain-containing protein [Paenibacillus eucommiae]|uniref:PDZ domain-containing protein n=1 Tax=Paenibacillus eucommiae TaxID=1355755 RepID=A0ABS4JAX1_9BACL|nr:PDZ domain-containing protein [Paenibacillus eucommiae]MBP1996994.1 PDZ domain-containing protein [Paenibacillus eucommiae]
MEEGEVVERTQRYYIWGMAAAICIFILGELAWLPDPLRIGSWFWIDDINLVVYLIVAVPLLWLTGAVKGIAAARKRRAAASSSPEAMEAAQGGLNGSRGLGVSDSPRRNRLELLLKLLICVLASSFIVIFIMQPHALIIPAALLALTWLLVCVDIALAEHRMRQRRMPWRAVTTLIVSLALLAGLFWPTSYMVTYPGLTMNMNRYAAVEGGAKRGDIMGVLVFERPAFPADWLYARLFPHYAFEPRESLGMTLGEYDTLVRELKVDANEVGSAVAFREAGVGSGVTLHGARVLQVMPDSPATGQLQAGDVVIQLDGSPVSSVAELIDRMKSVQPGAEVSLVVQRDAEQVAMTVKTKARDDDPKSAVLSIQIQDEVKLDLPRKVAFRPYFAHEGGPSHGAALALTLVDQLTPGGVTNGHRVAVTGTINGDGSVGKIGGIEQKAYTVERAGADVFFVPAGQEAEAKQGSQKLLIVPVATLSDILKWLKEHPRQA